MLGDADKMKWVTCREGRLEVRSSVEGKAREGAAGLVCAGAVHELLFERRAGVLPFAEPVTPALVWGRELVGKKKALVWFDLEEGMYPPAVAEAGVELSRFYMLRPKPEDLVWAVAECLRCSGVGAVVAKVGSLSRVEARRLQLAAEAGGSTGILVRAEGKGSENYAAATRWKVAPALGDRRVQRWRLELLHGQGRRGGEVFVMEISRASLSERGVVRRDSVRIPGAVVDREEAARTAGTSG